MELLWFCFEIPTRTERWNYRNEITLPRKPIPKHFPVNDDEFFKSSPPLPTAFRFIRLALNTTHFISFHFISHHKTHINPYSLVIIIFYIYTFLPPARARIQRSSRSPTIHRPSKRARDRPTTYFSIPSISNTISNEYKK